MAKIIRKCPPDNHKRSVGHFIHLVKGKGYYILDERRETRGRKILLPLIFLFFIFLFFSCYIAHCGHKEVLYINTSRK